MDSVENQFPPPTTSFPSSEFRTSWLNRREPEVVPEERDSGIPEQEESGGPKSSEDCYEYYFYDDDGQTMSVQECINLYLDQL